MAKPVFYSGIIFRSLLLCLGLLIFCGVTQAQASPAQESLSPLLSDNAAGDLAMFWLSFLFDGETTSSSRGTDTLTALAIALRQALNVYGLSMFVIGGFLLLAQLVSMIAETAQSGVVMGRRANQLWAPIRLLVGIVLLIPFGSGLSLGQHAVVKIAASGSELASEAWQGLVESVGDKAFTPLTPRLPDVGRVVSVAVEMELCRSMYQLAAATTPSDSIVGLAGAIQDFKKRPSGRLSDETWSYTNEFFPRADLCGSYSFLSPVSSEAAGGEQAEMYAAFVDEAAHASAERLAYQTRSLAGGLAPSFLISANKTPPADVRMALSGLLKEQTLLIEAKQAQIQEQWGQQRTNAVLASSVVRGWLSAGAFPFTLTREQISLGELSGRALPKVKAPLLGHDVLTREAWEKAARDNLQPTLLPAGQLDTYNTMYRRLDEGMRQARTWLYKSQVGNVQAVLPDQQELKDALGLYTDSELAQTTLARLVTTGAISYGVFARSLQSATFTDRQNTASSPLPDRSFMTQPLQTLAEMGRRYMGYGSWLLGMLSPAFAEPATMGMSISFGVISILFWVAGACLLFAVPFIPFFRFVIAALGWGLSVLGAVLSLPLVALAHLNPSGEGFAGPLARQAYWLWLSLFIRPALILLGFVGGLLFFFLGVALLNSFMLDWVTSIAMPQSQAFWVMRAGLSLLYALAVLILAHVSFRGLTLFPQLLNEWVNTRGSLPETLAVAGTGQTTGSPDTQSAMPIISVIERGGAVASGLLSNLSHSVQGRKGQADRPSSTEIARRQAQAAQFPHVPEMKAAERVQARAEAHAFARAESGSGAEGGKPEVVAAAAASSNADELKAMAIARHMVPDDKGGKVPSVSVNLLAADLDKLSKAMKKVGGKPEDTKAESAEQEATAVDAENNPFASDKPDTKPEE